VSQCESVELHTIVRLQYSEKYRCYYSPLPDFLFIFPCALVYLTAYLGEATHRGHTELR
jgi:hypothetical protein